jgi:hypothetical protein
MTNLLINSDFLPEDRKVLGDEKNDEFVLSRWEYAKHFDKNLPQTNPEKSDIVSFRNTLLKFWDKIRNLLIENLTANLQKRVRGHRLHLSDTTRIESIQDSILSYSHTFSNSYLELVLEFFKHPLKYDKSWILAAQEKVSLDYSVIIPVGENFVYHIARHCFNDTFQQRMRRGMLAQVGAVWYERKPVNKVKKSFKTLFQGPVIEDDNRRTVYVCGVAYNGYIVRRDTRDQSSFPDSRDALQRALDYSNGEESFLEHAKLLWRRNHQQV